MHRYWKGQIYLVLIYFTASSEPEVVRVAPGIKTWQGPDAIQSSERSEATGERAGAATTPTSQINRWFGSNLWREDLRSELEIYNKSSVCVRPRSTHTLKDTFFWTLGRWLGPEPGNLRWSDPRSAVRPSARQLKSSISTMYRVLASGRRSKRGWGVEWEPDSALSRPHPSSRPWISTWTLQNQIFSSL